MKYLQQLLQWCLWCHRLLQGHPNHRAWWRQLQCLPLLNMVTILGKMGWMVSFLLPHLPGRWWNSTGRSSSEQNQMLPLQALPRLLPSKAQLTKPSLQEYLPLPQVLIPWLQWLLLTLPMLPQLSLPLLPQPERSLSRQNLLFLQFLHPPWFPLLPACCLSQKPLCPPRMWLWLRLWPEPPLLIWCPAHRRLRPQLLRPKLLHPKPLLLGLAHRPRRPQPLRPKLLHLLRSRQKRQRLRRCCPQITCVYVLDASGCGKGSLTYFCSCLS